MGNKQLQKEKVEVNSCTIERVESDKQGLVDRICSSSSESTDGCMQADNYTGSPDIQTQSERLYYEGVNGHAHESSTSSNISVCTRKAAFGVTSEAVRDDKVRDTDVGISSSFPKDFGNDSQLLLNYKPLLITPVDTTRTASVNGHCHSAVSMEVSYCDEDVSVNNLDDSEDTDMISCETSSLAQDANNVRVNGHIHGDETAHICC